MYFRFLVVAALAAPLSASHLRHGRELLMLGTGTCGGGSVGDRKCANGQCCSKRGYCGLDSHHCDNKATSADEAADDSSQDSDVSARATTATPSADATDDSSAAPKSNYDGNYSEVLQIAKQLPSATEAANLNSLVTVVRQKYVQSYPVPAQDIFKMLPLPPDSYPGNIQGLMWMDIAGHYGYSTVPSTSFHSEGLFTLGETKFANLSGTTLITSGFCGGNWVLYDNEAGRKQRTKKCLDKNGTVPIPTLRRFVFSDDFETAYIDQWFGAAYMDQLSEGYNGTGVFAMNTYIPVMYRNHPPAGACPPAEDATKEEINLCATWIRKSYPSSYSVPTPSAELPDSVSGPAAIYPVFKVVGQDGLPIEPYFSALIAANLAASAPNMLIGIWQTPNDN